MHGVGGAEVLAGGVTDELGEGAVASVAAEGAWCRGVRSREARVT